MRRLGAARQPCIMTWSMTGDVEEYLAAAGDFLRSRPTENTVMLSVTATLQASGLAVFGAAAPLFGWWRADGEQVAGAFMQTPPFPVALSRMPAHAVTVLADALAAAGRSLPGVNADREAAAAFAEAWRDRTGTVAEVHTRTRLYRLAELTPSRPAPPGSARVADAADRDLVLAWFAAFSREVHSHEGPPRPDAVDDRLSYGGVTLWVVDGTPVSLASLTRPVAGMVRVGPVYTPPEQRGRGYAGAATAAVSRAALDDGVAEVLLFTDLANPTSNALYQRLGYRPVEDRVILTFKGLPDR
jgi:predicted GNAT family acetyltransferase